MRRHGNTMNKVIPNMGIAHLALKTSDFEKSLAFYKAIGMEPYISWGEGDKHIQMLKFGKCGILELFAGGKKLDSDVGEYAGKYIHFAYEVDDVEAAFNAAIAAGAKPKILPKVVALESEPEKVSINIAFVYGPDGEELEFFREIR